jgi:hypothetical protein
MNSHFKQAYPQRLEEAEETKIKERRQKSAVAATVPKVGVALSGGGIRSATFCLGVFQALARHKLLGMIFCAQSRAEVTLEVFLARYSNVGLRPPLMKSKRSLPIPTLGRFVGCGRMDVTFLPTGPVVFGFSPQQCSATGGPCMWCC